MYLLDIVAIRLSKFLLLGEPRLTDMKRQGRSTRALGLFSQMHKHFDMRCLR